MAKRSLRKKTRACAIFTDLPYDLLFLIFEALRPRLHRDPFDGVSREAIEKFRWEWRRLACMRLLSRSSDCALRPLLYENIATTFCNWTPMDDIAAVFAPGALIKSFVLFCDGEYDARAGRDSRYHLRGEVAVEIAKGLARCTQLQSLECYGEDPFFSSGDRDLEGIPLPSQTLKSFVIHPYRLRGLSLGLTHFSHNLERLEVGMWESYVARHGADGLGVPFSATGSLANLTHLTVRGQARHFVAYKLSSLMNECKKLRSFAFHSSGPLNWQHNLTPNPIEFFISNTEIGAQLTKLNLGVYEGTSAEFQRDALRSCPRLTILTICPADATILQDLPPRLQDLTLGVNQWVDNTSISVAELDAFVKCNHCHDLRHLFIHVLSQRNTRWIVRAQRPLFLHACIDAGIQMRIKEVMETTRRL